MQNLIKIATEQFGLQQNGFQLIVNNEGNVKKWVSCDYLGEFIYVKDCGSTDTNGILTQDIQTEK